jgi:large subunit ribosomal protein L32
MALPKKRHTSQRRDKRRTHIKLSMPPVSSCPQCGKPRLAHRICAYCGYYKGVQFVEVEEKKKKTKR